MQADLRLPGVRVDQRAVVARDLGRSPVDVALAREEADERVPPDRAADRETGVARNACTQPQPVQNLGCVGAAAEHDADDAVAATRARLRGGLQADDVIGSGGAELADTVMPAGESDGSAS